MDGLQTSWQQTVHSGLGFCGWEGTARGVTRLTFGHTSATQTRSLLSPRTGTISFPDWFASARDALLAYCDGEQVDLNEIPVDVRWPTPFAAKVIRALRTVGYGETISYGELAELAGAPRAARAVGTVMSHNPIPLIIPCHRVIGAGGKLGGYSAPQGLFMKRQLLEMEKSGKREPRQSHARIVLESHVV